MPMSPPRFFGFSRLELCLKVGSLGFRGTTNLHRQEEGHLFEWRALQTIKSCQQGSGHSKIHRITAGGSAALGWSKIRVAVLCLQSLVGSAHRVKGSGVSPSHLSTLRIGPSIFILLSTTTLSISSPQEANSVCSLLRSTWLLVEVFFHGQFCLPILDAARWWTRMRTTSSRVKLRPETIDGHMPCTQEGQWSC